VFSPVVDFQLKKEEKSMQSATETATQSRKGLWTGRILSSLAVLFLVFDGITKVMKESHVMAASAQLGFTPGMIVGIGFLLLICTAIYVIPRTSVLGAILLTGYLGGAVAINVRFGHSLFEAFFPVIFGTVVWAGIFVRDARLRALIPLRS
jgi:hypothetical protein